MHMCIPSNYVNYSRSGKGRTRHEDLDCPSLHNRSHTCELYSGPNEGLNMRTWTGPTCHAYVMRSSCEGLEMRTWSFTTQQITHF